MKQFADTFYFLALLNPKDDAYHAAVAHSSGPGSVITTEWVLTELADALAFHIQRQSFLDLYEMLRADAGVNILPANEEWFTRGIALFAERPDKNWSLTDCISFSVMERYGLTEALTGDHHFEQAGFHALLK